MAPKDWMLDNSGDAMKLRAQNGLQADCVQQYREMNAKRGDEWEVSKEFPATSLGQKFYTVIKVGSIYPIDLKERVLGANGVGVIGRIYEIQDSDVVLGTPERWYNFRLDITSQPDVILCTGTNITFVTPVTSLAIPANKRGADLFFRSNPQNIAKGVSASQQGANRIIYQNRLALLELESLDTQDQIIQSYLEIFEGLLDYPNNTGL